MPRRTQEPITFGQFYPESAEQEKLINEQIIPLVNFFHIKTGKPFVINCSHGDIIPPDFSARRINLNFFSLPEMPLEARASNLSTHGEVMLALGDKEITLSNGQGNHQGDHWAKHTTEDENHLVRSDNGIILAEVWWNTIYIAFDILHSLNGYVFPFMKFVLSKAIEKLDFDRKDYDQIMLQKSEKDYIALQLEDVQHAMAHRRAELNNHTSRIDSLIADMARTTQQVERIRMEMSAFSTVNKDKMIEKAKLSYKMVGNMIKQGMYRNFRVTPAQIEAETGPIFVRHHSDYFSIGRFNIKFIRGSHPSIVIKNVTNAKGGYDHPHISGNRPCWGNIGNAIGKLLGRREYPALLQLLHKYLCSYNDPDAYAKVYEFWSPTTKEQMQKELEGK